MLFKKTKMTDSTALTNLKNKIDSLTKQKYEIAKEINTLERQYEKMFYEHVGIDMSKEIQSGGRHPNFFKDAEGNKMYKHHSFKIGLKLKSGRYYQSCESPNLLSILPFLAKAIEMIDELHGEKHAFYQMDGNSELSNSKLKCYYSMSLYYKRKDKCCKYSTKNGFSFDDIPTIIEFDEFCECM